MYIACRHGIYGQNDPSPSGLRPRARAVSDDKSLATCLISVDDATMNDQTVFV